MKSLRFLLPAALLLLATAALAQSDAHKLASDKVAPSEAQKSFSLLKSLAGTWEGEFTTVPKMPQVGENARGQITMRVASRGNSLIHEMKDPGTPDDPTRYDHPVTMFYVDSNQLILTHYCDAGNRPRMVARSSPDGKTVEFDFLDVTGDLAHGHMQHAVFTIIDTNHHIEEWTYMMPGDKPVRARADLKRVQ
jgi:hypothetical protein